MKKVHFMAKKWSSCSCPLPQTFTYTYLHRTHRSCFSYSYLSCQNLKGLWGLSCRGSKAVCRVEGDEALRKLSVFPLCWSRRAGCFSPTLPEHSQKRKQSAVRLMSCQTIPVKALFWWRGLNRRRLENVRKKCIQRGGHTLNQLCALAVWGERTWLGQAGMIAMGCFWINGYLSGHVWPPGGEHSTKITGYDGVISHVAVGLWAGFVSLCYNCQFCKILTGVCKKKKKCAGDKGEERGVSAFSQMKNSRRTPLIVQHLEKI